MLRLITSNVLLLGLLVSCAKEKAYEEVYKKPELQSKADFITHELMIDEESGEQVMAPVKYLYVPMTLGTPREVKAANPFYQGDEKVVRLQWSKKGLEVLEIEKDSRFSENDLNDTPVLTIPGEFKSFRCKEDEYGDCTGSEEENTETVETNRSYFLPSYANLSVEEVNMLDLANIDGEPCVQNIGTKLTDYEISKGVINIELEKTYKLNSKSFRCIWENYVEDKLSYNSFKVRFFYSMVRLDMLAGKDYQAIEYPIQDHDKFGYFKTKRKNLDDNFDPRRKNENYLVNRWNPKRKNGELVYHLSKTFNKPKNKVFLDATYKAVDILNKGLDKAGSPFKVKLIKQKSDAKEISPGDLRYNSIVLIDDPLANGLLGYGPSVANPYTGEIVQAHTNMYGGVLTSTVRRVYEGAVDLTVEKAKKPEQQLLSLFSVSESAYSGLPSGLVKDMAQASGVDVVTAEESPEGEENRQISHQMSELDFNLVDDLTRTSLASLQKKVNARVQTKFNYKKEYVRLSQNNFEGMDEIEIANYKRESRKLGHNHSSDCHPEFFPIGGTVKVVYPELLEIEGILNSDGTLKRWEKLTLWQQEQARKVVLTSSYISTFIHEIGHNLGLRHNFQGSWDKNNFYTDEEAKELGMTKAPAYSSVMDYSFSEYNELKALGKYDIAALRFAYARKVEAKDGSLIDLKGPVHLIEKELHDYAFCTDENAGLSAMCNRFDEGTNLIEIAAFRAKRYEDAYKYRNFRDGRLDFSAYDLSGYLSARNREFKTMRMIFEEYERFTEFFSPELMAQGCGPQDLAKYPVCKMINERRDAVKIVGDFFVNILKTPDHICAVAKEDEPLVITEFKKLEELYEGVKYDIDRVTTSCFDEAIKKSLEEEKLIVVGETGKFLNSFKDADPNYKYNTDRAVLGTWGDKVLAMKNLFIRRGTTRTTDKNFMALVDIPFIKKQVENVLGHYSYGEKLDSPLAFKTEKDELFQVPYVIGNNYKIEQLEDAFAPIKGFLGLSKNGKTNLSKAVLAQISKVGVKYGIDVEEAAYTSANYVTVKKFPYLTDNQVATGLQFYDGRHLYEASKDNVIASKFIGAINNKVILDKAGIELVTNVFKQRTTPDAPEELNGPEKSFFNVKDLGLQQLLIQLKGQGVSPSIEQFVATFGEEEGKLIHILYGTEDALKVMQKLVDLKVLITTNPNPGAGELEVSLFKLPIDLVEDFTTGKLTDDLIDYYKGQLKKLPKHMYIED